MFAVVAHRNIQPLILLEFFNDFCSSEQDQLLDRDASEVPENYEGERNMAAVIIPLKPMATAANTPA